MEKNNKNKTTVLQQLLDCTNPTTSPVVKIKRNKIADTLALDLKRKRRKNRPGPLSKTRTIKNCTLCHISLIGSSHSHHQNVTLNQKRLLSEFVLTPDYLKNIFQSTSKNNLNGKSSEWKWMCSECSQAIERISEFEQEIQGIESKIGEIVQCIRAVYRLRMKTLKKPDNADKNKNDDDLQDDEVDPLSQCEVEDVEMSCDDYFIKPEIDEIVGHDDDFKVDTSFFEDTLNDAGNSLEDIVFYPEVEKQDEAPLTTISQPSRPSRQCKMKAKELLANLDTNDEDGADDYAAGSPTSSTSDSDSITCKTCNLEFTLKRSLLEHYKRVHEKITRFKCQICPNMEFYARTQYKNHHLRIHKNNPEIDFEKLVPLKSHGSDKNESDKTLGYCCEGCGLTLKDKNSYRGHYKRFHQDDSSKIKCEICSQVFLVRKDYVRHYYKTHHSEELKQNSSSQLRCPVNLCGKEFVDNTKLMAHVNRVHYNRKEFVCSFCGKILFSQRTHDAHLSTMHTDVPKARDFKCNICTSAFTSMRYLQEHTQSIHEGVRKFNCQHCKKAFFKGSNLRIHLRSCNRPMEEKLKCNTCIETFLSVKDRKIHERTLHQGKPTFSCKLCSYVFLSNFALTNHLTSHSKEKKFECGTCNAKFTKQARLTHHKETKCGVNEGEQIFSCTKCPKTFVTIRKLGQHTRTHHPTVLEGSNLVGNNDMNE